MSNTNTGGPAFPVTEDNYVHKDNTGMTLRDYFAAKAMQAIVSNGDVNSQKISQASYVIADAMLEAREA